MEKLYIEAFMVGIILLIVSIPVMRLLHGLYPEDYSGCENLPSKSKNKYYVATFAIGALLHLMCEFSGINRWYCKNGNACNPVNVQNYDPKINHPALL
jgi:hypothetical protein